MGTGPERDADGRQTRREGTTLTVEHPEHSGCIYTATVNLDSDSGAVFEIFYDQVHGSPVKDGSELSHVLRDATILISLLHQRAGMSFADISAALGECRAPGATSGPPASVIGAMCRAAAGMENETT